MSSLGLGRHALVWIVLAMFLVAVSIGAAVAIICDSIRPFELAVSIAAALATLAAVVYAADAAHEARSLRREERLARLPELVAELVANLYLALPSTYDELGHRWVDARSTRARLQAALELTGQNLPACRALTTSPLFAASEDERVGVEMREVVQAGAAAMAELVELLRAESRG